MTGRIEASERRRLIRLRLDEKDTEMRGVLPPHQRPTPPPAAAPGPDRPIAEMRAAPRPSLRRALDSRRAFLADPSMNQRIGAIRARVPPASSLRDEVLGDGQANCLERAVGMARPGDRVVLLDDARDDSGHAVVQRADGTIGDPNAPDASYDSLEDYQRAHPQYVDAVSLSDTQAETVLRTAPGAERDALIQSMGLGAIADRRVADAASDQAFADWALADAASLGLDAPVLEQVEQEANTVRATLPPRSPTPAPPPPLPAEEANAVEAAAQPELDAAADARNAADAAEGFADWALVDAASLGVDAPTLQQVEQEANTVRREELPALQEQAVVAEADANRALAVQTFEQLGIEATEEDIASFSDALGGAQSEEERRAILEGGIDAHRKQETFDAVQPRVDGWVTDVLGEQGARIDREDLMLDVESMVASGMTEAEIEASIRERMDAIRTRGLNSITGGAVVEGFTEAEVIEAGLALDRRDRDARQREVLDTLQVTLGVRSDEALAEQLGIGVDQLGDTLVVRNAQNAEDPQGVIEQLQADPRYAVNAERRRLEDLATYALADAGSLGLGPDELGLAGVTDLAVTGEIIENSGGVDAVVNDLGRNLGPNGEDVEVNLTQDQRNELALERGFLVRNGYSDEEIAQHLTMRANTLHWQNESQDDIDAWAEQGIVPEFGYDPVQSGRQLELENNAARTQWALGVAADTADGINAWQAEQIGATQGVQDATARLQDHWRTESPTLGSEVVGALGYTFGGASGYMDALERVQENPSVDEIRTFRDNIQEVLDNDLYRLSDADRAMFEASIADFDEALAGAQSTRDAASGNAYVAASQDRYGEMVAEFDRVDSEAGGWLGRFNKEALGLDHRTLGAHADLTEEEITAFEALASIPESERTDEQQAAYSVLAQGLLGTNTATGATSGTTRFDQGDRIAEGFEAFVNDNSKQSIVLGSAIVGTGVSFFNPVAGSAIVVGGTGAGLSLDKVTGNDDLTWGEVGVETGIALGSVGIGYGVNQVVGRGAGLLNPTSRGGRAAVAGGAFLTEELASEVLINGGATLARGDELNANALLDPVGLLYGLPFGARDAVGTLRGASPHGSPDVGSPHAVDATSGRPLPLSTTPTPGPNAEQAYFDAVAHLPTRGTSELGQLTPAELRRVYPEGGAYPYNAYAAGHIHGFANLAQTDPARARRLADAIQLHGTGIIDDINFSPNPAQRIAHWESVTPSATPHPSDANFVVRTGGPNRLPTSPELEVRAGGNLDHNGVLTQVPAAGQERTLIPRDTIVRPEQIRVDGRPRTDLDGVAVFSAHGGTDSFQGASTEQAADLMFESIVSSGRPIDSVVLEACNQRNGRIDLSRNGVGIVRSNGRDFERLLNEKLRAAGRPEVTVYAPSRSGLLWSNGLALTQRAPGPAIPGIDPFSSATFTPTAALPRPYAREWVLAGASATAVVGGGGYVYTQLTEDDD